jgi:hypothetical protein
MAAEHNLNIDRVMEQAAEPSPALTITENLSPPVTPAGFAWLGADGHNAAIINFAPESR